MTKVKPLKRIETYAYPIARLRARRGLLLKKSGYEAALKTTSPLGLLRFISSSSVHGRFIGTIEELGDLVNVEKRIMRAYYDHFEDVRKMLKKEVRPLLDAVYRKFELEALKSIIRAKSADVAPSEAFKTILPIGRYDLKTCENMLRARDMLGLIALIDDELLKNNLTIAFKKSEELRSPLPLEVAIDRYAYSILFSEARKLTGLDKKWINRFLGVEVDIKNIVSVIRGKTYGLTVDEIKDYVIVPHYYKLDAPLLIKAASAPGVEGTVRMLDSTPYAISLSKAEPTPLGVEKCLTRHLIREYERVFVRYPFHTGFIYAFLNLCFFEVRDVRAMLIGKAEELPADAIAEHLILYL